MAVPSLDFDLRLKSYTCTYNLKLLNVNSIGAHLYVFVLLVIVDYLVFNFKGPSNERLKQYCTYCTWPCCVHIYILSTNHYNSIHFIGSACTQSWSASPVHLTPPYIPPPFRPRGAVTILYHSTITNLSSFVSINDTHSPYCVSFSWLYCQIERWKFNRYIYRYITCSRYNITWTMLLYLDQP